MPYIEKSDRQKLEIAEREGLLSQYLTQLPLSKFVGHLNYIIFKSVKMYINKNGRKYFIFSTLIVTIVCCILEIYRRLIVSYEEDKIYENGDIV